MILAATREVIVSSSMMFDLMCLYEVYPESLGKSGCTASEAQQTEVTEKSKQ